MYSRVTILGEACHLEEYILYVYTYAILVKLEFPVQTA